MNAPLVKTGDVIGQITEKQVKKVEFQLELI